MRTNSNPVVPPAPAPAPATKPVSPRKQAANRSNAAQSTGPRTVEGKARSSLNAVRHGLSGHTAVLPGEDLAEFERFGQEMQADLRPRGVLERQLVERIAGLMWRLRRAGRLEGALWETEQKDCIRGFEAVRQARAQFGFPPMPGQSNEPPEPAEGVEFLARQFDKTGTSPLERLAVYEQRLDRSLHAALRQLRELQKQRLAREEDEPHDEPATQAEQNEPTAEPSNGEPLDPPGAVMQNEPTAAAPPALQVIQTDPPDRPPGVV